MTRKSKVRAQFLSAAGQPERKVVVPLEKDSGWVFAKMAVDHVVIRRSSSTPIAHKRTGNTI